ncbi:hypothetical protein ACTFIZ_004116 [Dictyostelium cf. discoideum]
MGIDGMVGGVLAKDKGVDSGDEGCTVCVAWRAYLDGAIFVRGGVIFDTADAVEGDEDGTSVAYRVCGYNSGTSNSVCNSIGSRATIYAIEGYNSIRDCTLIPRKVSVQVSAGLINLNLNPKSSSKFAIYTNPSIRYFFQIVF